MIRPPCFLALDPLLLLLLLLLLLGVVAEEPSAEFCNGVCGQAEARKNNQECKMCSLQSNPGPSRGDMRRPDYDDDIYDYDTDIQPVSGLETDCSPDWCSEHCSNCSDCSKQCNKWCPCTVITRDDVKMSVSCTTSQAVVNLDLSNLLSLNTEQLSVNISLQEGDRELQRLSLTEADLSEEEFTLEQGTCRGDYLNLCLHLHHPALSRKDDKHLCENCLVSGPPHFLRQGVRVLGEEEEEEDRVRVLEEESGVSFFTIQWNPAEPTCHDTRYRVLVDGAKLDMSTVSTKYKVGVTEKLSPGVHQVSVLAENNDGDSEVTDEILYTIHSLSLPDLADPEVTLDAEAHLVSSISWQSQLSSTDGGFNITVTNPDGSSAEGFPKLLDWSTRSLSVRLDRSDQLATLRLQTVELDSSSEFSPPVKIFRSLTVSSPDNVKVTLFVAEARLAPDLSMDQAILASDLSSELSANISWSCGVTLEGSPVFTSDFTTELQIWEGEGSVVKHSLPLQQSSYTIRLSEVSWRSKVRLAHSPKGKWGFSPPSPLLPLFSTLELSPPHNIKLSFSFDGELVALLSWDNTIEQRFAGVLKTILLLDREETVSRSRREVDTLRTMDYTQTEATLRLSELGWGSIISLQVGLGDERGEETDRLEVFTEEVRGKYLAPPKDIQLGWEGEGEEELTLSWETPNTVVPVVVRLYHQGRIIREDLVDMAGGRVRYRVPYRDIDCYPGQSADTAVVKSRCDPWELGYTLVLQGESEGRVVGLVDMVNLLPPETLSVTCSELCHLSWCLPSGQIHLQGMGTILNFWNSSLLLETIPLERTARCGNTNFTLDDLKEGAEEVSLQSTIPGKRTSEHSHRVLLVPSLQPASRNEDTLGLIIGLSLLLLLYVVGTVLCLRRARGRGGYDIAKRNQASTISLTPKPPKSEASSRDTEQESIISDGSAGVLLPSVGSVASLGTFNEDDLCMGNFDEDGSFIGDYREYNKVEQQAVQNRLLEFVKMYKKPF